MGPVGITSWPRTVAAGDAASTGCVGSTIWSHLAVRSGDTISSSGTRTIASRISSGGRADSWRAAGGGGILEADQRHIIPDGA